LLAIKNANEEYERVFSNSKAEIDEKSKEILKLKYEIDALSLRNAVLEDANIPTEADSIKEVTMKNAKL
jgi:hypothetical protein